MSENSNVAKDGEGKGQQDPQALKEEIKRDVMRDLAAALQGAGDSPEGKGGEEGKKGKEGGEARQEDGDKKGDSRKDEKGGEGDKAKRKFKWTPLKIIGLVVLVAIVIVLGIRYFIYAMGHETTNDAYTTGYVHQISSRVTSNVTELLVVDNQRVRQGQVLLRLDPTDYLVVIDRARANFEKAKADFDRVDALKADVAISKQDYDQTRTTMETAKADLKDAEDQLSYCTIVAPSDGFIGNRTVDVGNRVVVGGALMAVVQDVWVIANFKETQLGKMKKNQKVKITVDAIPKVTFDGHVDSFSPGTGAVFALLPPDNATGNFTKIVQRVPVKILFEPASIRDYRKRIVPGLSVEPSVELDQNVRAVGDPAEKAGE